MQTLLRDPRRATIIVAAGLIAAIILALGGRALYAQIAGDRGIAAVAASGDIQVGGIDVDVTAKTAEEAREQGWKQAMKLAWKKIDGPAIPDGQLYSLVSSVVIEHEELGPGRYIARLGVVFDRARAGGLLGRGENVQHSAPLLLVPVTFSAGTQTVYEIRNPWQRAWAEYQPGASKIDYVRPSGAGGDSLLLTYGQVGRRSRTWWRNVLDQFGASDVLIAIADLDYAYPGGPVKGTFTARHGPDSEFLESFTLSAPNQDALPAMLDKAVLRFNAIFESALDAGKLKPDSTLNLGAPQVDPALQRLIEYGRAAEAQERARQAQATAGPVPGETPAPAAPAPAVVSSFSVQFATPNAGAFDASLSAVRATPGVRGAAATSTAIGGTSVMTVSFAGDINALAAALRARGFTVRQAGAGLAISR
ncbi:heavy-metal-associated domain-containing protein [Tsuneonella sp. YG55]|uniref:Heavy-metal-associated domain-containing protein n=1 Tax=Tsuneonella litorea TaxID=2976475 RepID=A0A9X3A900_9SPHN|nr:heavy-metal-associated domain-containing protein [Tsuneonella litorea]MCT2558375.1 heavy-metal-associated domain-containing protein [Tsuneonella litorea]